MKRGVPSGLPQRYNSGELGQNCHGFWFLVFEVGSVGIYSMVNRGVCGHARFPMEGLSCCGLR